MSTFIRDHLEKLNLSVNEKLCQQIQEMVIRYEIKKTNPLTLSSRLLGVHPMYFLPEDRSNLFHLFGIEEKDFAAELKKIPRNVIDPSHRIASDPFNNFCIWIIYLLETQIPNSKHALRKATQVAVAKYLNYKYFTSIVNYYWSHGADESVMFYVTNHLSNKFDIVRENNWKGVFNKRAEDLLSEHSVHKQAIATAIPDKKFTYIVTDQQNRIREKIKLIASEYYTAKEHGDKFISRGATLTDNEGDKILVQQSSTISSAKGRIGRDLLNYNAWVDYRLIRFIARQFPQINPVMLKNALTEQSALATSQSKAKKSKDTQVVKGKMIILSQRLLVESIISTSIRFCAKKGISLKQKQIAWTSLRNMFASSRTLDTDVVTIKNSMEHFVDTLGASSRPATVSSLRMAIILYVIYRLVLAL